MQQPSELPPYLALIGPTGSGKTAAALALAQRHPVEIISMDSALVYRGMDIGSAKPSAAEQAAVMHHLIDIRDPLQAYSAAEFARDARALMQTIHDRGHWPVLVGGTMLYLKALQDGLDDMPQATPQVRLRIAGEAAALGWPALHARLAGIDPVTAARLAPNDAQRISRALEVFEVSGRPLSAFQQRQPQATSPKCLLLSLEPGDRAWLHARIAQRFEAMLSHGFLDEVQALRERGDLHLDLPSMRCVGYRQAWQALDGLWPLHELPERAIAATRQLAKRQLTWLRGMPARQVIACDQTDPVAQALSMTDHFIDETVRSMA